MLLYTNGCSFTYGDELKQPSRDAWPYVLGKKLNWDTINSACVGGSVIRAYRQTLNFLFNNLDKKEKMFIIICWPPKIRSEAYYNNRIITIKTQPLRKYLFMSKINHIISDYFLVTKHSIYCFLQSVCFQYLLHNILKYYKISHIFFETTSIDINLFSLRNFKNQSYIKNIVSINKKIDSINRFLINSSFESFAYDNHYAIGLNMHPLEEAHAALANLLYIKIQKDY